MWITALADLRVLGAKSASRAGDVHAETLGWHGALYAEDQYTFLCNPVRKLSEAYAAAETLWYMSGSDDATMLTAYAPSYVRFTDENLRAYGAYGPRVMHPILGVNAIIKELRDRPSSRRAVLPVFHDIDLANAAIKGDDLKDVPCTCLWQFFVRDGRLRMFVYMRSNDVWLGLPYDVFAFTCFQRLIAKELGVGVGQYDHVVGSLHLYEKNAERAKEAVTCGQYALCPHGWRLDDDLQTAKLAVDAEKSVRASGEFCTRHLLGDMCRDLVLSCGKKFGVAGLTQSKALLTGE